VERLSKLAYFIVKFSCNVVIKSSLQIQPHLKRVTALPYQVQLAPYIDMIVPIYRKDVNSPPKVIWEECIALVQLRNKVSIGYTMGRPKFTPIAQPTTLTISNGFHCYSLTMGLVPPSSRINLRSSREALV